MKKLAVLVLTVLTVALSLCGCSSRTDTPRRGQHRSHRTISIAPTQKLPRRSSLRCGNFLVYFYPFISIVLPPTLIFPACGATTPREASATDPADKRSFSSSHGVAGSHCSRK